MARISREDSRLVLDDQRFMDLSVKVKQAYDHLDGALAHTLRLNADMIETAQDIGLEPEIGQKLFSDFNDCINTIMTSRQKMVAAHTRATVIRMRTSQAERADGCWPWRKETGDLAPHLRSVS